MKAVHTTHALYLHKASEIIWQLSERNWLKCKSLFVHNLPLHLRINANDSMSWNREQKQWTNLYFEPVLQWKLFELVHKLDLMNHWWVELSWVDMICSRIKVHLTNSLNRLLHESSSYDSSAIFCLLKSYYSFVRRMDQILSYLLRKKIILQWATNLHCKWLKWINE